MPQPVNFTQFLGPVPNVGAAFQQGQDIAAKRELERTQSEAAIRLKQQQSAVMNELMQKDTLSGSDLLKASAVFGKDRFNAISSAAEQMTKEEQQSAVSTFSQAFSAASAGRNDIAENIHRERAEAERNRGDEEEAKAHEMLADNYRDNPHASQIQAGVMLAGIPGGKEALEAMREVRGETAEIKGLADPVARSEILPDGTVQLIRKSGAVEIKTAKEADKELIKQARAYGATIQGLRSGERGAASASVKQSLTAFKQLAPIRKSIMNIDNAIRTLDEGAKTGAVEGRLPSIRAASVKLDNIQAQMGLDVIGTTTFGALSESELAFALSAALPKGLNETELREWLIEKRDAQQKLSSYLEETAIYLGTPGNGGIPGFINLKRSEQAAQVEAQSAESGEQRNVVVDY